MASRILVIDDNIVNLKMASTILKQAGYEVLTAQSGPEALRQADHIQPDLIIVDLMMPDMDGYEVCRRLRSKPRLANLPIMMLTAAETLEEKVKGYEAGADDYMVKPFQPLEFQARVKSLLRRSIASTPTIASRPVSRTLALFSLRGGVGVSTLAINLAISLAQIWQFPTVLVDMNLTCGHDAMLLNLPLRNTWADLGNLPPAELERDLVERALLSHPSGLRVLAAPPQPQQEEKITGEHVAQVITWLKEQYYYLVLDLPHDFRDTTLAGLDTADQIAAVMTPELASVYATSHALNTFEELGYSRESVHLILNQIFLHNGLARSDIEAVLKHTTDTIIPFGPDPLISAINTGVPLVIKSPDSPIGVLMEDMAFSLSQETHKAQQPTSPTLAWKRVAKRVQQRQKK
jgi:pilus assembly protein CpaE